MIESWSNEWMMRFYESSYSLMLLCSRCFEIRVWVMEKENRLRFHVINLCAKRARSSLGIKIKWRTVTKTYRANFSLTSGANVIIPTSTIVEWQTKKIRNHLSRHQDHELLHLDALHWQLCCAHFHRHTCICVLDNALCQARCVSRCPNS